jgi:hypothetical protein
MERHPSAATGLVLPSDEKKPSLRVIAGRPGWG